MGIGNHFSNDHHVVLGGMRIQGYAIAIFAFLFHLPTCLMSNYRRTPCACWSTTNGELLCILSIHGRYTWNAGQLVQKPPIQWRTPVLERRTSLHLSEKRTLYDRWQYQTLRMLYKSVIRQGRGPPLPGRVPLFQRCRKVQRRTPCELSYLLQPGCRFCEFPLSFLHS